MNTVIFSDDFYTKDLFKQGEKICVNASGTFEIAPKEGYWNRFKRFVMFGQDTNIDAVHTRFQALANEINTQSGPLFNALTDEVHAAGSKKFKCLELNLKNLREKLDHVGHLNVFSRLMLKISNLFRSIIGYPAIALKTYSTIRYDSVEFWWMADHFWSKTNKVTTSSFTVRLDQVEKQGLNLRAADIIASDLDLQNRNELYSLERGLTDRWLIQQTSKNFNTKNGTQQILIDLEITFDSDKKCFKAAIRNPRQTIPSVLDKHLDGIPDDEKSVSFYINYHLNGQRQIHELNWIFSGRERSDQLMHGSKPFSLEPDVTYTFTDESGAQLESFTIKMK